jgi:hypothetical protein
VSGPDASCGPGWSPPETPKQTLNPAYQLPNDQDARHGKHHNLTSVASG